MQTPPKRPDIAATVPAASRHERTPVREGRIEPPRGLLDHPIAGPAAAVALLVLPALLAVLGANQVAAWLEPPTLAITTPLAGRMEGWPGPLEAVLAGDYGLLTMGPLLFVWAVPTVLVYSALISVYKASGLADRIGDGASPAVAAHRPARTRRDASADGLRVQCPGGRLDTLLL